MVTLYNVVSADWFIAKKDGSEDFIPDKLWGTTLGVYKEFDVLLMGRKTYEALQSYRKELLEPFERLAIRKFIVSRNNKLRVKSGYAVVQMPEEIISQNSNVLVSSGPTLNNYLFDKKLVNKVILHLIPVNLDEGIPVFDSRHRHSLVVESELESNLAKEIRYNVITSN